MASSSRAAAPSPPSEARCVDGLSGADGGRLLESVIAGYEIGSRIGGATQARPNVHSHGTWGTISTATAVARLNDLASDDMRRVINLSASMSPANTWTPALEGATIR